MKRFGNIKVEVPNRFRLRSYARQLPFKILDIAGARKMSNLFNPIEYGIEHTLDFKRKIKVRNPRLLYP